MNKLSDDIKIMIEFLHKISENMELYYKINYNLIVTYEIQKRNYQILQNINIIKDTIKIEDIDEIISNIEDKFYIFKNIYEKIANKDETDNNETNNEINIKYSFKD